MPDDLDRGKIQQSWPAPDSRAGKGLNVFRAAQKTNVHRKDTCISMHLILRLCEDDSKWKEGKDLAWCFGKVIHVIHISQEPTPKMSPQL